MKSCTANSFFFLKKIHLTFAFSVAIFYGAPAYSEPRAAQPATLSYGAAAPLPKPAVAAPVAPAPAAAPYNGGMPPPVANRVAAPPANNFGKQVGFTPSLPRVGDPPPRLVNQQVNQTVNYMQSMQINKKVVNKIKTMNLQTLEANSTPYVQAPKAVTRTVLLDLSPGVAPPSINLSAGNLTSIVFSDMYGDAWMIERVSMNRRLFNDDGAANIGDQGTNVITVEPTQAVSQGNMSVILKGMATPIIFTLRSGQNPSVDFRVDVKVTGYNPDAKPRALNTNMPDLDNMIPYFLDGVPPKEARKIQSSNPMLEAWDLGGKLYIRTAGDMQYPAYHSSARSTSGVAVYRFNQLYRLLTVLQNGRVYNVTLEF